MDRCRQESCCLPRTHVTFVSEVQPNHQHRLHNGIHYFLLVLPEETVFRAIKYPPQRRAKAAACRKSSWQSDGIGLPIWRPLPAPYQMWLLEELFMAMKATEADPITPTLIYGAQLPAPNQMWLLGGPLLQLFMAMKATEADPITPTSTETSHQFEELQFPILIPPPSLPPSTSASTLLVPTPSQSRASSCASANDLYSFGLSRYVL